MDYRLNQWLQENFRMPGFKVDPLQKVIETGPWKYLSVSDWVRRLSRDGWHEAAERLSKKYSEQGVQSEFIKII